MDPRKKAKLVEAFNSTICFDDIMDDLVLAVAENLSPEEVFGEDVFLTWAEENGYKREGE